MTKFAASDHHFYHDKIIAHSPEFGQPRPFATIEEHNETLIANHNRVVGPNDTTYFGGDVIMNTQPDTLDPWLANTVGRMNGRKIVILGNHCTAAKVKAYAKYFDKIIGYLEIGHDFIYSHIPVHVSQVENRFKANIHGHVHSHTLPDPRYFNVSMEAIDYTPISFADIKAKLRERGVI